MYVMYIVSPYNLKIQFVYLSLIMIEIIYYELIMLQQLSHRMTIIIINVTVAQRRID